MRFLDALKGGGGDAIRQSTSLTMAYLLEQNRKFEAYMRGKVEELEARVAAQQARLAAAETEADESDMPPAPLVDEASLEATALGGEDLAVEVEEVVSFGMMAVEEEAPAEETGALPEPASAPGEDALVIEEGAAFEMEAEEEAGPPSWQAMLVGTPPAAERETALEGEEPAEGTDDTDSLLPDWSVAEGEDVEETDSLLLDWSTAGREMALESEGPAEEADETDSLLPDWSAAGGEAALKGEELAEDADETNSLQPETEEEMAPEDDDGTWESPLNAGQVEEWA